MSKSTTRHRDLLQRINELIDAHGLSPGDKLPSERKLAELLGASRNSLREALRSLAQQGRLRSRPGDGTYVHEPGADCASALQQALAAKKRRRHEVFALRRILEPGLAELAAQNATAADIKGLKALVFDQQRALEGGQDGQHLDEAFHVQLARATHNSVLLDVMLALQELLSESRAEELQRPRRRTLSPKAHFAIIDAVEARAPERAREAMERHLAEAETMAFEQAFSEDTAKTTTESTPKQAKESEQ